MKKVKYKCINPSDKYDVADNKYTWEEWKAIFLGWFNENNMYALAHNLRSLSKDDVFKFIHFTLDLEFQEIGLDSLK